MDSVFDILFIIYYFSFLIRSFILKGYVGPPYMTAVTKEKPDEAPASPYNKGKRKGNTPPSSVRCAQSSGYESP